MNQEEVRYQFSQACAANDIDTAGFIFSKHLDVESKFSQATFDQGLIMAVRAGAVEVARYLLDEQNFRVPHKLSPLYYTSLFDCQNETPNVQMLECLCLQLPNKEELLKIQEEEDFPTKDHFVLFLSTRLEREIIETSLAANLDSFEHKAPQKERRFKI